MTASQIAPRQKMMDWLFADRARGTQSPPVIEIAGRTLPIVLRRHPTAKRLILRLAPDGSAVKVTLPRWGRNADAIDFARERALWIERQLARIEPPPADPVPHYRGAQLMVEWSAHLPRRPELAGDTLMLGGPKDTIAARTRRWLEGEALRLFETDAAHYCTAADLPPAPVKLSRARRRWGSCSSAGVLRLNWRLVQAPDHVRRSVVAHEVAHLVHFDHSPQFHAVLAQLYDGDLADANRWLKRHGRTLYRLEPPHS